MPGVIPDEIKSAYGSCSRKESRNSLDHRYDYVDIVCLKTYNYVGRAACDTGTLLVRR